MKFDPDAVQSWNLPVPSKPRPATVRVMEVVDRGPYTYDETIESVVFVRRRQVVAIDFYRSRPA